MKLEPIIQMPSAWTGFGDGLGVHLFHGKLTLADLDRLETFGVQWRRKHPEKVVEMSIIFPSDARLDGDERKRLAQVIKRGESQRVASATVVLAGGMLGALHRSVLTGLAMLAPPPHPAAVCGSVRHAVTWLDPHLRKLPAFATAPDRTDEVLAAIDELSAAFHARR